MARSGGYVGKYYDLFGYKIMYFDTDSAFSRWGKSSYAFIYAFGIHYNYFLTVCVLGVFLVKKIRGVKNSD